MTDNGDLIAAPGSLASTKSHLSGAFELLAMGQCGDWNPATQTSNPMLSVQVRTMLKGYGNHATQLGYQKRGALKGITTNRGRNATATAEHAEPMQQQQQHISKIQMAYY